MVLGANVDSLDWSVLEAGGKAFENLCADIFRAHDYDVRLSRQGGGDRGKDLIIHEFDKKIDSVPKLFGWAECKDRRNSKKNTLQGNQFFYHIMKANRANVPNWYLITNGYLTNFGYEEIKEEAKYQLKENLSISVIEKDTLEIIIKNNPIVYKKYFGEKSSLSSLKTNSTTITARPRSFSNLTTHNDFDHIQLNNVTGKEQICNLSESGFTSQVISLKPFEETLIKLDFSTNKEKFQSYPVSEFIKECSLNKKFKIHQAITAPPLLSDLYVDPYDNLDKCIRLLSTDSSLYIKGHGGTGKTQLFKEIVKRTASFTANIDLAINGSGSLTDEILFYILGVNFNSSKHLIDASLTCLSKTLKETSRFNIIYDYIVKRKLKVYFSYFQNYVADLVKNNLNCPYIVIDNFHLASLSDLNFVKLLFENKVQLVILARPDYLNKEEFIDIKLSLLFEKKQIVDLSIVDTYRVIDCYITRFSRTDKTKEFLLKYKYVQTLFDFVSIIRCLIISKFLKHHSNGSFELLPSNSNESKQDRKSIINSTIQSLFLDEFDQKQAWYYLTVAAEYGYEFPLSIFDNIELQTQSLVLDKLLDYGIFIEIEHIHSDGPYLRFDHEFTKDIINRSVNANVRLRANRAITQYFEQNESMWRMGDTIVYGKALQKVGRIRDSIRIVYEKSKSLNNGGLKEKALYYLEYLYSIFEQLREEHLYEFEDLRRDISLIYIQIKFDIKGAKFIKDDLRALELLLKIKATNQQKALMELYWMKFYSNSKNPIEANKHSIAANRFASYDTDQVLITRVKLRTAIVKKNLGLFKNSISILNGIRNDMELNLNLNQVGKLKTVNEIVWLCHEAGHGKLVNNEKMFVFNEGTKLNDGLLTTTLYIEHSVWCLLYQLEDINRIESLLSDSIYLADKMNSTRMSLRARLNMSNFLYFIKGDILKGKNYLSEAIDKYSDNVTDNLNALLIFSRINQGDQDIDSTLTLIRFLEKQYPIHMQPFLIGDWRLRNIFNYILNTEHFHESKILSNWNDFIVGNSKWQYLNSINPYCIGKNYITLY